MMNTVNKSTAKRTTTDERHSTNLAHALFKKLKSGVGEGTAPLQPHAAPDALHCARIDGLSSSSFGDRFKARYIATPTVEPAPAKGSNALGRLPESTGSVGNEDPAVEQAPPIDHELESFAWSEGLELEDLGSFELLTDNMSVEYDERTESTWVDHGKDTDPGSLAWDSVADPSVNLPATPEELVGADSNGTPSPPFWDKFKSKYTATPTAELTPAKGPNALGRRSESTGSVAVEDPAAEQPTLADDALDRLPESVGLVAVEDPAAEQPTLADDALERLIEFTGSVGNEGPVVAQGLSTDRELGSLIRGEGLECEDPRSFDFYEDSMSAMYELILPPTEDALLNAMAPVPAAGQEAAPVGDAGGATNAGDIATLHEILDETIDAVFAFLQQAAAPFPDVGQGAAPTGAAEDAGGEMNTGGIIIPIDEAGFQPQ